MPTRPSVPGGNEALMGSVTASYPRPFHGPKSAHSINDSYWELWSETAQEDGQKSCLIYCMAPMTAPSPTPRRRRFQFSLRALLIVTAIIAIWLGWWSYKARQQRVAVAKLRKIGADVWYDVECHNMIIRPPHQPAHLVESMVVDYFDNVWQVVFYLSKSEGQEITNSDIEVLGDLGSLRSLDLHHTDFTDAGLEHLKRLRHLEHLVVNNNITDAGVQHLKGLTALEQLDLRWTQVTDAGLEHLKNMTALYWLDLRDTKVTDAGVARLKKSLPTCTIER
ncbi:MAG: hypothetical protein K8T25_03095 [Planctomycetia bacterium]|nr:hypothetical protein [Planctomycetia bacterium]